MEMEQNLQDPHQDMANEIEQSLNPRIISSTPTMENGNKKTQKKIGKKKVKMIFLDPNLYLITLSITVVFIHEYQILLIMINI
jgi:hypothetical protein